MKNRHEVLARDRIARAYEDVRDEWLADPLGILQHATTTGLSGLFGAKLRAPLGPLEVCGEIVVDVLTIEQVRSQRDGPATTLEIEWGAMRCPELFPTMRATMSIYPLTPSETMLELSGTYEPPLGAVGRAIDEIVMHRIAKESVNRFLRDVARLLERVSDGTAAHRC